jgi:hypothetical protein
MRLRAPRAAIVFPADEGWHDWARLALYTASQLWGGKGFVLIPHTGRDVDPIVLSAVVAYDPDYVVQLQVTLGEYEGLRPGALSISSAGRVLGGAERAAELARNSEEPVPHDAGSAQARAAVAAACAPYRQRLLPDRDPSESTEWISAAGAERQFTSVRDLSAPEHWPYLAAPPAWGGALGVAVAARCGMVEPPERGVATPVEGGEQSRLARWLLDPSMNVDLPYDLVRHGGGAATSVRPSDCPPGFDRTTTGLTWITHRAELHPPAVVMIGDTAADFAVSMIWDRIYGDGYWLPSVLGNDDLPAMAQRLLLTLVQRSRLHGRKVRVMSRSVAAEAVLTVVEALRAPRAATEGRAGASAQCAATVVSEPIEFPRGSTGHWAVEHHWDQPLGLPVKRDEAGGHDDAHATTTAAYHDATAVGGDITGVAGRS